MTPSPSKQVIYTYTVLGGELRCGIPPTVTDPNWRLKPLQCTERFIISIIISQIRHLELRVSAHPLSIQLRPCLKSPSLPAQEGTQSTL